MVMEMLQICSLDAMSDAVICNNRGTFFKNQYLPEINDHFVLCLFDGHKEKKNFVPKDKSNYGQKEL